MGREKEASAGRGVGVGPGWAEGSGWSPIFGRAARGRAPPTPPVPQLRFVFPKLSASPGSN